MRGLGDGDRQDAHAQAGGAGGHLDLTGGVQLPGKPCANGTRPASRYVDVGEGFEVHRGAVESVSVLFDLYEGDVDSYMVKGSPGEELSTGWVVTGAKFEVEWPANPDRAALVRSHFGARRKAFNWGLAQIKSDLDVRKADPACESVGWDLGSLRWAWNRAKDEVAPWWAANSKEAYSSGLADLARALENWKASKDGTRVGRRVGFPRFKSARRDAGRVRFSTGAMRLDPDRRTIVLPRIGPLRSKENTRRVPHTGAIVNRDTNAARNLRDWPDHASCGPVGATVPSVPGPTKSVGTGHGADTRPTGAGGAPVRPHSSGAGSGEARTKTPQGDTA